MLPIAKVNVAAQLDRFQDYYNPRIIADLNGQLVKLVKFDSEFVWHHHDDEDELFFVVTGTMRMEFRDQTVDLGPGELIVVPRGVEHRPSAPFGEVAVMLFEPATTLNTGNVRNERTRLELERL